MSVKADLVSLFRSNKELTVKELTEILGASKQMIHIALNQLVDEKFIQKLGRAPKTVYRLVQNDSQ